MTLAELIADVDENRPSAFDKDKKTAWVNEVEARVAKFLNSHIFAEVEFTPYVYDRDAEKELLLPAEYANVYETYLYAKADYANAEIDRYNTDAVMHEAAWNEFKADYRQSHYPKAIG